MSESEAALCQGLPVAQQTYLFKEPYIETMQPYILRRPKNRLGFSATGRVRVSGSGGLGST